MAPLVLCLDPSATLRGLKGPAKWPSFEVFSWWFWESEYEEKGGKTKKQQEWQEVVRMVFFVSGMFLDFLWSKSKVQLRLALNSA